MKRYLRKKKWHYINLMSLDHHKIYLNPVWKKSYKKARWLKKKQRLKIRSLREDWYNVEKICK